MEPYTRDGILKKEKEKELGKSNIGETSKSIKVVTDTHNYYELVGVVVHSGQASAGHYYSYVKNRQYVYE